MRFLLALLALLAAPPAAAQAPDFTALVKQAAPSVVNLTGRLRLAPPDLPPAEDDDEEAALLRDFVPRAFGPPEQRLHGSGFVIE